MRLLADHDEMYDALLRRDPDMDGVFFVAVKTTGVFCRPVCPSRTPLQKNVEFFATTAEAEAAGYRACKRCRPLQAPQCPPGEIARLADAVRADPARQWSAADLKTLGLSAAYVRRGFRQYFGQTFAEFVRSHRLATASEAVRNGARVIDAQGEAGYESGSGLREAFTRSLGVPPSRGGEVESFSYDWVETPLGPMLAVANENGLHMLEFIERKSLRENLERFQRRHNAAVLPGTSPAIEQIRSELDAYFAGRDLCFATRIAASGTPFQRQVWDELRSIPPGDTETYSALARRIGRPRAVRAVANANANNTIAIVLPCHRIVGSDGALTGYAAGLWRKKWLLDHEREFAR